MAINAVYRAKMRKEIVVDIMSTYDDPLSIVLALTVQDVEDAHPFDPILRLIHDTPMTSYSGAAVIACSSLT